MAKHAVSIKLEHNVYSRLVLICKQLGVTPHAYMQSVIGKEVRRDELTFVPVQSQEEYEKYIKEVAEALSKMDLDDPVGDRDTVYQENIEINE